MRPVSSLAAYARFAVHPTCATGEALAFGHGEVAIVRLLCSPATMLHDIAFEGRKLRQDSPKPPAGAL